MASVNVRLPDDLHEALVKASEDDERSLNGEIVWVLRGFAAERARIEAALLGRPTWPEHEVRWYDMQVIRGLASLVAQGATDQMLERAKAAYEAVRPVVSRPPVEDDDQDTVDGGAR